jgi:large subunit ribosomal protein L31e
MAEENKVVLEREFIVPLREGWLKAPRYKRGKKALKILKEFMVRHMKIYDRDLRKIKVDTILNNEILFRGIKQPLGKVKVKAIKYDNGEVSVKLVDLPKHVEFQLARKARKQAENLTKQSKEVKEKEKKEESKDTKEKEESSKLAMEEIEKAKAKELEHTSKTSQETPKVQRKTLKK